MLNQFIATGNLGDDPKVFYSPDGNPVTSFNLAFQAGKKKTCWIKVVTFHKLAEVCSTYLHKGARIAIAGILLIQNNRQLRAAFGPHRIRRSVRSISSTFRNKNKSALNAWFCVEAATRCLIAR